MIKALADEKIYRDRPWPDGLPRPRLDTVSSMFDNFFIRQRSIITNAKQAKQSSGIEVDAFTLLAFSCH
ncbi:MAG: hypothetical protein ACREBD_16425 [Blastocatellia bacterium]